MKKKVLAIILALGLAMSSFTVTGLAEEPLEPAVVAEEAAETEDTDTGSEDEEEYAEPQAVPADAAEEEPVSEDAEDAEAEDDESFVRPEPDKDAHSLRNGEGNSVRTIVDITDNPGEGEGSSEAANGTAVPTEEAVKEEPTVYTTLEEAAAAARDQMIARQAAVTVAVSRESEAFSGDDFGEMFYAVYEQAFAECSNARGGDYLRYQTGGYNMNEGGIFISDTTVTFVFNPVYYTTAAQEEEVDAAVSNVLAQLNLSGQPEDYKAAKIYDYIASHVVYDYAHLNDNSYMLQYTAYAALINGTSVCQGYAVLFYRLCKEAGLSVRIISGEAKTSEDDDALWEAHSWDIVRIGSLYYAVDVTWDAGQSPSEYKYFLKSETDMAKDHRRKAMGELDYTSTAFHTAYPMAETSLSYPESAIIPVTGIELDSTQGYVLYGQPYRIQATVLPADAFYKDVTFDIVENTVGYRITSTEEGGWVEITPFAPSDGRTGTVVVKIASKLNPDVSATCTITTVSSIADLDMEAVQLNGNSLSLNGSIGVNFYVNMKESVAEKAEFSYSVNGKSGTASVENGGLTYDNVEKCYKFTVLTVAKEMQDSITVTVKDKEGNPIPLYNHSLTKEYTEGYQYSVAHYLELAEQSGDEKLTALVKATDDYGKYAQVYFNHNAEGVAPDAAAIANVTASLVEAYAAVKPEAWPEGLNYYGSSLLLKEKTGINHYFTVDEGHLINEYTFKLGGTTVNPEEIEGYYRITISDIPAAELGTKITLTVSAASSNAELSYCPMSYVYSAITKEIKSADVSKALYNYFKAADAYFNQQ